VFVTNVVTLKGFCMTNLTTKEVIEMSRQTHLPYFYETGVPCNLSGLEAFAKLVAQHEREACAKICGRLADEALVVGDEDAVMCFEEAEDLIRTRSKAILRGEA
jgi:hypothetical protein